VKVLGLVLADIVAHAREAAPAECCGLLLERDGVVFESVRVRNALASRTRYLVHPEDHFSVLRRARLEGLRIGAAYHSHPAAPARPSATDVAEANDPDLVHVIVSLAGGAEDVKAWRIAGGAAEPVHMEIVR
jgi:[CysO sulfur-carrier protein]-S-L-cysteine hydrolase